MKLDMDLVRGILLGIEELDNGIDDPCEGSKLFHYLEENGYDTSGDRIYGHCEIMSQGGLIDFEGGEGLIGGGREDMYDMKLCFDGHEFLNGIRDRNVWKDIKAQVSQKGVSVSIAVLKALVVQAVKKSLFGSDVK